ncbi:branched-chain amino acid transaminase [Pleionea litopenaei]|uniref:Branched-chain-amino-acid aminotransferase n=1 Tax=Pleionea litopenaei TaxID=3070815 RepID=A0AA51X7L6_9GAMM|nr:branched-chain amino acid transaminase [Pleionea sp. HL-JVS1]WMS88343.1 branched-chain amino acid transaminase [Pleionea sp. HL-JVS1]
MAIKQPDYIWFNGKVIHWHDAKVHVLSHAIHYGSSVFEGIRCYETDDGVAIFRLQDHIRRLYDSAKIYRMELPFAASTLEQACRDVIVENRLSASYIRPVAFRGYNSIGVLPFDNPVEVAVAAFEWGAYLGEDSLAQGVDVAVSSWNRAAPNTIPTAAKAGGNYLSSQLVVEEAKRHGYAEGIALDTNGYISEGSGENIFVVRNGTLYTPPATAAILPGLTRDTIMTLAEESGWKVVECNIAREALYLADEVFMTGTAAEIVPVRSVDGQIVGAGCRGPITEQLQQLFFGLFNGKTQDQWGWLEHIYHVEPCALHRP